MKKTSLIFFKLLLITGLVPTFSPTQSLASEVDADMGQCFSTLYAMYQRNMTLSPSQIAFLKKAAARMKPISDITDKCDRQRSAQECISGKLNQADTDFFWGAGAVKKPLADNFYTKTAGGWPLWEQSYIGSCLSFKEITSK